MTRSTLLTRTRVPLALAASALLACGLARPTSALAFIQEVSKDKAKELGISVTSGPSANDDLLVQVEFKTSGPMKEFRWADMEVRQNGKRVISAGIQPRHTDPGKVLLHLYMDPATVPNASVTVFVYNAPLTGTGYQLKLKDFIPAK